MAKVFLVILSLLVFLNFKYSYADLQEIEKWLKQYNKDADKLQREDTLASWKYETDMTDDNKSKTSKMSAKTSGFATESRKKAEELLKDVEGIPTNLIRQLKLITRTSSSESEDESQEITNLISKMTAIYSKTSVSLYLLYFGKDS